jgi:hypothetical protein
MAKSSDRDFFVRARKIVEHAIGEHIDGTPLPSEKDTAAMARGRKGGRIGGAARAKKLSPEQRKKIAERAARARWHPTTRTRPQR